MLFDVCRFFTKNYQSKKINGSILENRETKDLYVSVLEKTKKNTMNNDTREQKQMVGKIDVYKTNQWRVKIPKLKLDAPITEGTSTEALRRTVGHFKESDIWEGNVCLAGHNRGYRCNFFQEIKKLKKGDEIIYCTSRGERRYQVIMNTIIRETDWTYLHHTKDNHITLITCEKNKREYRRCIQGIEIKDR